MRILTEPQVYLIARPIINEPGFRGFLEDHNLEWPSEYVNPGAETIIELAGRCCYMSFGSKSGRKSNEEYIRNLVGFDRDGPAHGSVLEHCNYTFLVSGAGRGFSHEQVRHRIGWAYSQLSTRYCDFEREEKEEGTWEPGFCIPHFAQLSDDTKMIFESRLKESLGTYKHILEHIMVDIEQAIEDGIIEIPAYMTKIERNRFIRKMARGAARDILPIATEAIMTMTGNIRSIWNCLYLRAGSKEAEAQIRSVYVQIAIIMKQEIPAIFNDVEFISLPDGTTAVKLPREKL